MSVNFSIADIDNQLSETGQFSLPEWLLDQNLLPYARYEAWRYGELNSLTEALGWDKEQLQQLLKAAASGCGKLKLQAEPLDYFAWTTEQKPLKLSADISEANALASVWRRPEDMPQMDLFMDNSAVVGENTLQLNLAARQFNKAQQSLKKLTDLNPRNAKLGAYQDLLNYGLHMEASPNIDWQDYPAELDGLLREVAPLAKETLKALSRDYLANGWRRLAGNSPGVIDANSSWQLSPAFALSQIPDWSAVLMELKKNASTYQHPELLCLLANGYFYSDEPQLGYFVWGQIAERFPEFAETAIGKHELAKKHVLLTETWDAFLAFDEHWPSQWFLGYLLIARPGLVHLMDQLPQTVSDPIKSSVNQTVLQLVQAKIRDEDQKLLRAQLKSAAPSLLKFFMNKRDWYAR